MDLEALAIQVAETEIPHVVYESSSLSPDALLIAKALISMHEAFHGGEDDLRDHITRVLDLPQ